MNYKIKDLAEVVNHVNDHGGGEHDVFFLVELNGKKMYMPILDWHVDTWLENDEEQTEKYVLVLEDHS